MDESILPIPFVAVLTAGGIGVYLLLQDSRGSRFSRPVGIALCSVALGVLLVLAGLRAEWWPASALASMAASLTFIALSGGSLIAAVMVITPRRTTKAVLWFALLIAFNVGLLLFQSAAFAALTIVLLAGGASAAIWLIVRGSLEKLAKSELAANHEPWLACTAGTLLSLALVGSVHHAYVVEGDRRVQSARIATIPSVELAASIRLATAADREAGSSTLATSIFEERWIGVGVLVALLAVTAVGAAAVTQRLNLAVSPRKE